MSQDQSGQEQGDTSVPQDYKNVFRGREAVSKFADPCADAREVRTRLAMAQLVRHD